MATDLEIMKNTSGKWLGSIALKLGMGLAGTAIVIAGAAFVSEPSESTTIADKSGSTVTIGQADSAAPAWRDTPAGTPPQPQQFSDAAAPQDMTPKVQPEAAVATASVVAPAAAPVVVATPPAPVVSVRGVTDHEIRFGMAGPLSGTSKQLGLQIKLGI